MTRQPIRESPSLLVENGEIRLDSELMNLMFFHVKSRQTHFLMPQSFPCTVSIIKGILHTFLLIGYNVQLLAIQEDLMVPNVGTYLLLLYILLEKTKIPKYPA